MREDEMRGGSASKVSASHAGRARSQHSAPRLTAAIALAALALLTACDREPDLPPLPPASPDRSQAEALQRMNTAGATAFAGWTWRYEFGAGRRMRVIKRYEGRSIPVVGYVRSRTVAMPGRPPQASTRRRCAVNVDPSVVNQRRWPSFFARRWRGEVPMHTVLWRDMQGVGTNCKRSSVTRRSYAPREQ